MTQTATKQQITNAIILKMFKRTNRCNHIVLCPLYDCLNEIYDIVELARFEFKADAIEFKEYITQKRGYEDLTVWNPNIKNIVG